MTKIFHITGTQCCGKSYLINKIKAEFDCASWDILEDFYIKNKILVNNEMDWKKYSGLSKTLPLELENFIEDNLQKVVLIETSGINKTINDILPNLEKKYGKIIQITLDIPSEEELSNRAKNRNLNGNKVVGFAIDFSNLVYRESFLSLEQAYKELKTKLIEMLTND
jgi:hypothetical protein